jgi:transcriptional regulator with XRE-family HTH domain
MGRSPRKRPVRLAEKLRNLRKILGLSQAALIEKLESKDYPVYKGDVSNYESNKSEPPLVILLRYARLSGLTVEMLIDDELDLPESLPRHNKKGRNFLN